MIHSSLRNIQLVDRTTHLCDLCSRKKVLHLGATDAPETENAVKEGRFLHNDLTEVSSEVVGMDINESMITWLRENYGINNIQYGNIEVYEDYPRKEFDIIIAGEILEHLSNQGKALDCLKKVATSNTKLIITVPNAYSLKGFVRALAKHELIHPDHTLHYSLYTLTNLLNRHGFFVESCFSFVNGGTGLLASVSNLFIRANPQLAEGVGVVCRLQF